MKNLCYLTATVLCLTVSIVFGSGEDTDAKEKNIGNLVSGIVGRVEEYREECPNLPEQSGAEKQLKQCLLETREAAIQALNLNIEKTQYKALCGVLPGFLDCSSSLIDAMVSCGKNPELITIIGLLKGACEYENQNGLEGLETEFEPCFKGTEAYKEFSQCAKEDLEDLSLEDNSVNSMLDLFCPGYTIVNGCARPTLEKHCPKLFVELSSIYDNSRSLSGDSAAFDACLAGSSSL